MGLIVHVEGCDLSRLACLGLGMFHSDVLESSAEERILN